MQIPYRATLNDLDASHPAIEQASLLANTIRLHRNTPIAQLATEAGEGDGVANTGARVRQKLSGEAVRMAAAIAPCALQFHGQRRLGFQLVIPAHRQSEIAQPMHGICACFASDSGPMTPRSSCIWSRTGVSRAVCPRRGSRSETWSKPAYGRSPVCKTRVVMSAGV